VTDYLLYGEWAPSVIQINGKYRMIYCQTDPLDALHGLAIAIHPPEPFEF